jgi:rod shape determining protein RodA
VILYSAGFNSDYHRTILSWPKIVIRSQPFFKQMTFLALGFAVCFFSSRLSLNLLNRLAPWLYGTGLLLLLSVFLFGTVVNGSRRWLSLGIVNLQPSEFVKISTLLLLCRYFALNPPPNGGYTFNKILIPLLIIFLPFAFIVKQPDLGTALSVGVIGASLLLFLGIRFKVLATMIILAVVAVIPSWYSLHDYQKNRVLSLLNPDLDPRGTGYHILQSKIAVGSGGLTGKGYLNGTQAQLEFLPEHTTDFIFSVLAEEWGFIGCIVILIAYLVLLFRIIKITQGVPHLFGVLLGVGIAAQFFFHIFVNIGMVIGILPVVGIPLPFLSYGGSSLIVSLFSIGLILRLSRERFDPREPIDPLLGSYSS